MDKTEDNLLNLQSQNQCLISQLANANGQIRSYRGKFKWLTVNYFIKL